MAVQFPEITPVVLRLDEGYFAARSLLANDEPGMEDLFRAAHPGYPGNFTRDSLIAARLRSDIPAALRQVAFSSRHQGKSLNAQTGEEPGKMHHELPAVDVGESGYTTAYNACDTTALYLGTLAWLAREHDGKILDEYEQNVVAGVSYVTRHVGPDRLFIDDPAFAGAKRYSLRVTYWKDSILNTVDRVEPVYPVVYTQPHFQNAEALTHIGCLTNDDKAVRLAEDMYAEGLQRLWAEDHFVTAIDQKGVIDPPSSDSLMSLLHIPRNILPVGYASRIEQYSDQLETPAGYRAGIPVVPGRDNYHTEKIWTHEQALLHMAAREHNLEKAQRVAARIVEYIKPHDRLFPELIDVHTLQPDGNRVQLWAVETWKYFRILDSQSDRIVV